MAGPAANVIIASVTLPLYIFVFNQNDLISLIVGFICYINAFIATFNLLPFEPLDGVKIIDWNGNVWLLLFILSITVLVIIFPQFALNLSI